MKSVFVSVVSAALLAGTAVAQNPPPMVATPSSSTVCQPLLITWTGGTPPFFLSILPGGQPSAAPLVDFGQVTGNSMTWTVNVTNSELGINLRDSTGLLSQSAPFPNLSGTNNACLTAAPPGPTSGGPPPPGSTPPGTSAPPPTTPPAPPTTPPAPPTTPAPAPTTPKPSTSAPVSQTSPTPSPSPSAGAATTFSTKAGFAGAIGLAIVALFA